MVHKTVANGPQGEVRCRARHRQAMNLVAPICP